MSEKNKKPSSKKTPDNKTSDDGWKSAKKQMYNVYNELDEKSRDS